MRNLLLGGMWLAPLLLGITLVRSVRNRAVARALGITVAAMLVPLALAVFVSSEPDLLTAPSMQALARFDLEVDGLSAVLLPLVASTALCILVAIPRADVDVNAVASLLVVEAATLGALVSANVLLLAAFWALSLLPMAGEARRSGDRALRRATRWVAALCIIPMFAALAFVAAVAVAHGVPSPFDVRSIARSHAVQAEARRIVPLVLLACTARMGIFPFHSWVPIGFARGRLSIILPSVVSPLGSFALVRLGLGLFPTALRPWSGALMMMATVSALYGAVLALGQHDARRQLGFLWTSIAGFVLAGIATLDAQGLSGALVHDFASTIAITGLALTVRAVEARTGTADFRRLGGLVMQAPRMATSYFLLGMAAVGFPATVTFVSEDLVVQGLVGGRPLVAVLLLTAMAINGVTLVRSFKRIFLGPATRPRVVPDLLPRERRVAMVLILALLAGGFVPTPLLAIRRQVESSFLRIEPLRPPVEEPR